MWFNRGIKLLDQSHESNVKESSSSTGEKYSAILTRCSGGSYQIQGRGTTDACIQIVETY